MKLLVPLMTLVFHLLELAAAIVVFPLTAACILALMIVTLYVALRPRLPPVGQHSPAYALPGVNNMLAISRR